MKTCNEKRKVSALTYAIQGALAVMFAMPLVAQADENDARNAVEAMRHPTNTVEVGVRNMSDKSTKFGEYNGLDKKGAGFVGNFNLRGGDAYDSNTGTYRYDLKGKELGTSSLELTGSVSNQGLWNFGFGYDELTHYTTTGYQTPLVGAMGGNMFTVPAGFGFINTTGTSVPVGTTGCLGTVANCIGGTDPATAGVGTTTQIGTRNLSAAQLAALNAVDVGMTRKNTSFVAAYNIDQQWSVQFDYNHLKQDGAKLIGSGTSSSVANTAGGYTTQTAAAGLFTREANFILMNPSNYTTDNFNLGVNWKGENAHLHAVYSSSLFKDAYNGLYWESPFIGNTSTATAMPTAYLTNALSTAPSNQFHQLNVNGGYALTSTTKLAGSLSRGVNTQNEAFNNHQAFEITAMPVNAAGITQASLNGRVVTTHADLKLTDKSIQDLALSAGFKYNERNNQTPSMRMSFLDLRGVDPANKWTVVNTPYSNKSTLLELAGDYRLDKAQSLRLGYDHEDIKRWCNGILPTIAAASGAGAVANGLDLAMPIGTVPGCVLTPSSKEDRIGLTYKLKPNSDLSVIADLSHAKRNSVSDFTFVNPLGTTGQVGITAAVVGNGTLNAGNYYGFKTWFDASRTQDMLKLRANWSATDELSIVAAGRYEDNKYTDSPLGVQNGRNWSLNLDATYAYSDQGSLSAYVSKSDRRRQYLSLASDTLSTSTTSLQWSTPQAGRTAANTFANDLQEDGTAIGVNLKQQFTEAWDMAGDLSYSIDKSGYTNTLNYTLLTTTPAQQATANCAYTNVLSCGSTPTIESQITTLNLIAGYKISKASKVKFGYTYQKLNSTDYFYNGYQYGYTPATTMPTNQQAPSYKQHVIGVVYTYSFN